MENIHLLKKTLHMNRGIPELYHHCIRTENIPLLYIHGVIYMYIYKQHSTTTYTPYIYIYIWRTSHFCGTTTHGEHLIIPKVLHIEKKNQMLFKHCILIQKFYYYVNIRFLYKYYPTMENIRFKYIMIYQWKRFANYIRIMYKRISYLFWKSHILQIKVNQWVNLTHDDVIKWKHFPRYWPFVRGIHRSPVNSLHKGQWRGALMFSLICGRIIGWVNNREAGDLRRYCAHYDVIVMLEPPGSPFTSMV